MTVPSSFDQPTQPPRRPLRPLHGIPEPERRSRSGWFVSGLLHAIILTALLLPPLVGRILQDQNPGGAGGPDAAGGGGGGSGGTGGVITPERINYVDVAPGTPTPPPPVETPQPTLTPVPPPPPEPEPVPQAAQAQQAPAAPSAGTTAPTPGTGGGSGSDGSAGNGPGSGGGVGSGIGTGRGSGIGPGTGGDGSGITPPRAIVAVMLPTPVPRRVRPYRMVANFDVDERGNARLIGFTPSNDRGYNLKIREMLEGFRFRPATRADGTPVRDTAVVFAEAP